MKVPKLQSLQITPNPATQKQSIQVTVQAEDMEIIFKTEYYYAAAKNYELYAGEEGAV